MQPPAPPPLPASLPFSAPAPGAAGECAPATASLSLASPVGRLRLSERDGALVRLAWSDAPGGEVTAVLRQASQQLEAYFAGDLKIFDLPLAPAGTTFQRRVFAAMAAIPFGATRSYGALAAELGSVARAVGGACGANPLPILIPCHRVLAAGGRLGGFSGGGGVPTKTWLLRHEGALPAAARAEAGAPRDADPRQPRLL